jgi:hypothetical protein
VSEREIGEKQEAARRRQVRDRPPVKDESSPFDEKHISMESL